MVETRGARGASYTVITPENQYASRLPDLPGARVIKLVTPRLAPAQICQYLVQTPEASIDAMLPSGLEHFFFGLEGTVRLGCEGEEITVPERGFAYIPDDESVSIRSAASGRFLWIKRRFAPGLTEQRPTRVYGQVAAESFAATATPGLRRCELMDPEDWRYDFNMSLLAFEGDLGLAQIEIHDEEHGLFMTGGDGVYTLEHANHDVRADDFIYMAPYCPQGFVAGPHGAEYLLYKDVYRETI